MTAAAEAARPGGKGRTSESPGGQGRIRYRLGDTQAGSTRAGREHILDEAFAGRRGAGRGRPGRGAGIGVRVTGTVQVPGRVRAEPRSCAAAARRASN